jgi:hypothetical protein
MSKLSEAKSFKNTKKSNLKTLEGWEYTNENDRTELIATYNSDYSHRRGNELAVSYDKISSPRSPQKRSKVYLYEKMANIENSISNQQIN